MLRRSLALLLLAVLAMLGAAQQPSFAQLPPSNGIAINSTPVQGGTNLQCLYINSSHKVGAQACGAGTAADITVGTTTITGGTASGILWKNAGVLAAGPATMGSDGSLGLTGNLNMTAGNNLNWGTARPIMGSAADGTIFLLTNAGTVGGTINFATDATFKFFARDRTTPAAIQAGTLALGGATIGSNALAVTGAATFSGVISSTAGIILGATSGGIYVGGTAAGNQAVSFSVSGSSSVSIANGFGLTATGVVTMSGLGTDAGTTDSSLCLRADTKAVVTGTGTLGICLGTSSARYKRDIVAEQEGLDEIAALRPVNYRYRAGHGDDGRREQYGFLAEDVAGVLPKLVGRDSDGRPNTVDMLGMFPVMVTAIQQLKAEVDALRSGR